jgi:protein-S-isoprenylcysteine O-methyltransferase Ste14
VPWFGDDTRRPQVVRAERSSLLLPGMVMILRHLLAVAILPFTVAVLVPVWIARRYGMTAAAGSSVAQALVQSFGALLGAIGLALFVSSLRRFAAEGNGTLAPWDAPRRLVVRGPYRFVRNPMISGVAFILFAEACVLLSRPHATWAMLFVAINVIYIPLLEEPQLEARFGESYRDYCRNVPRLLPRRRPWRPGAEQKTPSGQRRAK